MKITINLGVVPFAPHWVGLFVALVHNDNRGDDPLAAMTDVHAKSWPDDARCQESGFHSSMCRLISRTYQDRSG